WRRAAGPAGAEPFAGLGVDLDRRAFGPEASKAPAAGPGRRPSPRDPWALYVQGAPPTAPEAEAASQYLLYFQAQTAGRRNAHLQAYQALAFGQLPGLMVPGTGAGAAP